MMTEARAKEPPPEGLRDFLLQLNGKPFTNADRAVGAIWFLSTRSAEETSSLADICTALENAGYGRQNRTWLKGKLRSDSRVLSAGVGQYRLNARKADVLDKAFAEYTHPLPKIHSASVVAPNLFKGTRGYIERVVVQINNSYDYALYDCCAVMCRRLLETLIIEVYEHSSAQSEIKGPDGNYFMFSGLLGAIEASQKFSISRNTVKALKDFKKIGDLSAHNRRYNARREDIDAIKADLRIAAEELLHLAGLA